MLKEGTTVYKCLSAPDDGHQDGSRGVIRSIMVIPEDRREEILKGLRANPEALQPPENYTPEAFYFVEWDDLPGVPVGIADYRVKEDEN